MEDIIKIKYRLDFNRLKDTYMSAYGAASDEYLREFDGSIADSTRNIEAEFDNEKVVIKIIDKNEKNTYSYNEIFKIKKEKDSYLFFISKIQFFYFKFSDFSSEDLARIDVILKEFYEKTQGEILAALENYELNEERVVAASKIIYKSLNIVFLLLGIILTILHQMIYRSMLVNVLTIVLYTIFILFFLKFYYKSMGKRIIKSTNKNFLYARILFYKDKIEVISKRKMGMSEIYYNEFYKIKKTKKGYLFLTQKYSFYFFFYDEFKKDELERLSSTLSQYI